MNNILVVDDDDKIRHLLGKYLKDNNYNVYEAASTKEARNFLDKEINIIIMDVMMPEESGINLTSEIKSQASLKNIPILMLSALSEAEDRINGLEIGADDYLTKPFEPKELLLRIQKLLERNNQHYIIKIGDFTFNIANQKLIKGNEIITLTSSELNLLNILAQNVNKAVPREEIAVKCYGISERSIDVQIVRLRNKIEPDPKEPKYLLTVRNIGYGLYL
ncbi:MAG: response regulator transcription factor [Sphingobacteriia bacterium]|nr:response regulator transcription factor [Sphingobacteriia bacterium]